jgi:glycosyltransferase involved in cell wall biosynthesis
VLAKRDADFELIVVDDGSTDGTLEQLARFDRTTIERSERRGPAAARNRGVALANAPLIAFLDSDDLWKPEKLSRQLGFMREHPQCEISQTGEIWIRNGRRVNPGLRHLKRAGDIFVDSLQTCLISPSAVILKTDLFRARGGFDEGLFAAEDYDLWLRILVDREVGLLDEPLITRRAGHSDQLSATTAAIDRFRVVGLMTLLADSRLCNSRRVVVSSVLTQKCRVLSKGARRRGKEAEADLYNAVIASASRWIDRIDQSITETIAQMRAMLTARPVEDQPEQTL